MPVDIKNTKRVLTWLICLTYAGMFFPLIISNITLIVLLGFCLYYIRPKDIVTTFKENPFLRIIVAMYFLQVIGLLYTTNYQTGFFVLEKKLSLLLIPLIGLPLLHKVDADISLILKRIGTITLLSSVVLLVIATFKTLVIHDSHAFYFENVTSIHYVYYSIYFASGSLLLIDNIFDEYVKKKYGYAIIAVLFTYSLIILILIASKTGIMAFGLASVFFLYKRLTNKKIFATAILLMWLSVAILFYFNETTRSRFTGLSEHLSVLTLDDFRGHDMYYNDLNMRLLFWKISVVNICKDHAFLTGVGTGDAQDYINVLYALPQYQLNGYIDWDSHNQWVYTFVQLGLIGVALMAFLYVRFFRAAFIHMDLKFISFLIITLAFSFSESILESNKGIVFFSLLFTLFSVRYKKSESSAVK